MTKLKMMLVFTIHAGIYGVPFVSKLKMMLVFTIRASIYTSCSGIYGTSMNRKYQHHLEF